MTPHPSDCFLETLKQRHAKQGGEGRSESQKRYEMGLPFGCALASWRLSYHTEQTSAHTLWSWHERRTERGCLGPREPRPKIQPRPEAHHIPVLEFHRRPNIFIKQLPLPLWVVFYCHQRVPSSKLAMAKLLSFSYPQFPHLLHKDKNISFAKSYKGYQTSSMVPGTL